LLRSLSLRFQVSEHLEATHREVLDAVVSRIGESEVTCLTQTRRGVYQVTVASAESKQSLLVSGIEVKESLVSCHSIQPDKLFTGGARLADQNDCRLERYEDE
jgi:hypothetical protein